MTKRRRFRHDTIAMIYDFDGTLTPQPMQEYTVLPKLGVDPTEFWRDVKREATKTRGDHMLAYMRMLLKRIEEKEQHITRADFRALGSQILYYPGVAEWFPRMRKYVRQRSGALVKLRNYIVSAGQKEILEGIKIRRHFHRIFASEYFFNYHGIATFPNVLINDTIKTQYIFRINKGREDIRQSINEHMAEDQRAVPFSNMVYFGDGMTDVPGMTVTKKNGGYAIAVHPMGDAKSVLTCKELLEANRVAFYAPADYNKNKSLDRRVKLILDIIIARILYEREIFVARLAD
ncbi:MAG: HAD family hydrolase [Candidatus Acidiferrales bacterium]